MDEITKIETIDQYDQLFGLETLHPLVNVVEFAKSTRTVEYIRMNIGFYCLFLKEANAVTSDMAASITIIRKGQWSAWLPDRSPEWTNEIRQLHGQIQSAFYSILI